MAPGAGPHPDVRELYERYGRAVFRRCEYFLRNRAEAEDALHDVFLKVVERYDEFRGQASPYTWIVRVTTNHCLNVLRSRRALWRERYTRTVEVEARARSPEASGFERRELVRSLFGKLDRKALEAAVYYFVDEMTQEDAARAARCSVPTLRKRLRKFLRVARRELKRVDPDLVFGPEPV